MSPARRDLLLAVVLVIAIQVELALQSHLTPGARVTSTIAGLAVLVVAWRTRRPMAVLTAVIAVFLVQASLNGALFGQVTPMFVIPLAALAVGGAMPARRFSAVYILGAAALTIANHLTAPVPVSSLSDMLFFGGLALGGPMLVGRNLSIRAAEIAALRERTARLADEEEAAVQAVQVEERSRLAQAVHEAVAERVAEIARRAADAERLAGSDSDRVLQALGQAEATARASLQEIREVIGILRASDETAAV